MSNKTTKTTTTTFSWSKFFKAMSFWAVILIALSLIFSLIPSISSALKLVGNVLAYIVALVYSFSYALYKRNIWYFIAWLVACVLIVVFVILSY